MLRAFLLTLIVVSLGVAASARADAARSQPRASARLDARAAQLVADDAEPADAVAPASLNELRQDALVLRNWGIGLAVAGPLVSIGLGVGVGMMVFFNYVAILALCAPGAAMLVAGVVMWSIGQARASSIDEVAASPGELADRPPVESCLERRGWLAAGDVGRWTVLRF